MNSESLRQRVTQIIAGALAARAASNNWTRADTIAACVVVCWYGVLELLKRRHDVRRRSGKGPPQQLDE